MNIILGGTSGLGQEIAEGLQANGQETFVIGRSYDEAEHGAGLAADLASETDVRKTSDTLKDLDITSFYWVSGYGYIGDFADQPNPEVTAKVNFANVLPIAQSAWNKLIVSEIASHFVVISSSSGLKARSDEAVYAATKHAQVGFTRSLGLESERLGAHVRVALFEPGGMQTPFWDGTKPAAYNKFLDPAKVAAHIIERVTAQATPFYEEEIPRGSL